MGSETEGAGIQGKPPLNPDIPMEEQFAALQRQREEEARRMQELMLLEAQKLQAAMEKNPELQKYAGMVLLGNRIVNWAATEISEQRGVTSAMVKILADSMADRASKRFSVAEMIGELVDKQLPWLESRRKDALMKERKHEKRLKRITQLARNKLVSVPFKAISDCLKDGFTHTDIILVFGPRAALQPVLRHCALHYQRHGGSAVLLSAKDGEAGDKRIAKLTMSPNRWRNSGDVYGEFLQVMEPVTKESINPYGLLVVDELDTLLMLTPIREPRPRRLVRGLGCLFQFQANYPMAVLVGVATDGDPEQLKIEHVYPPVMTAAPYVHVELKPSELVGGSMNVVIGEDIEPLHHLNQRLQPSGE